jgi:hypothetical protein
VTFDQLPQKACGSDHIGDRIECPYSADFLPSHHDVEVILWERDLRLHILTDVLLTSLMVLCSSIFPSGSRW